MNGPASLLPPVAAWHLIAAFLIAAPPLSGCQGRSDSDEPATVRSTTREPGSLSGPLQPGTQPDRRQVFATRAKEDLFEKLSGRLMEVMKSEGPVAAINVCSEQAMEIADAVGKEHGVSIGRTSFQLRNPRNAPKDWVKPFVQQRIDVPQTVPLDNGGLGVLFPIHLSVQCLMCHGGEEEMLDAVKPELAKLYPDDQATGFRLGELRGWFWVEVPNVPKASAPL